MPENVKVEDLFIDDTDIQLHLDVGDASIILVFDQEGFDAFKEEINKPPRDLKLPIQIHP